MSANPAPSGITPDTIVAIVAGAIVSITVAVLAAVSQSGVPQLDLTRVSMGDDSGELTADRFRR